MDRTRPSPAPRAHRRVGALATTFAACLLFCIPSSAHATPIKIDLVGGFFLHDIDFYLGAPDAFVELEEVLTAAGVSFAGAVFQGPPMTPAYLSITVDSEHKVGDPGGLLHAEFRVGAIEYFMGPTDWINGFFTQTVTGTKISLGGVEYLPSFANLIPTHTPPQIGDVSVDLANISQWNYYFKLRLPFSDWAVSMRPVTVTVPEPSALAVFATGVAAFFLQRRRRS